jgi:hypothetical protein
VSSAAGILAGVDDIIERHLGIATIGTRQPRFGHLTACRALSGHPPPAFDAISLVEDALTKIDENWRAAGGRRKASAQNWRFEKQLEIAAGNPSREKTLEKAIARLAGDQWANQVPTASGLVNGRSDRQRNLDLVFEASPDRFEFIELKLECDTPLYAAIEMFQYGALYIFSRLNSQHLFARAHFLLEAKALQLRILAPLEYYRSYRFDWLEAALTTGLQAALDRRRGLLESIDFRFNAFPDGFRWPCGDDALLASLAQRGPVRWPA